MDTKQNIKIKLGKNSNNKRTQVNIVEANDLKPTLLRAEPMPRAKGIAQDTETIWMTRRRDIKVKYFKGFTTAM